MMAVEETRMVLRGVKDSDVQQVRICNIEELMILKQTRNG